MDRKMKRSVVRVLLLAVGLALLGGCATTGQSKSGDLSEALTQGKEAVAVGKKQVEMMLTSLDALVTAQGDLKAPFSKFNDQLKQLVKMQEDLKKRSGEVQAKKEEYLKQWQEQMANIKDPEIKTKIESRRQEVAKDYADLGQAAQKARAPFDLFLQYLQDIKQYLNFDLTPSGIEAVKPVAEKAKTEGTAVSEAIGNIMKELDTLSKKMASSTGEAPKK